MTTTKIKFSPSVNIVRDVDFAFNYIPTSNSTLVFNQLLSDARSGTKSHLIIGAYGTGKSSLLLAFKQTLNGSYKHFKGVENLVKQSPKYEFVPVIGDYTSITDYFANLFEPQKKNYSTSDIITAIDKHYKQLQKKGKGIAFLIDEFGKFLEYAAKNNPEVELYFIQQLAEWVNNTKTSSILIGTLHQDFNTYSFGLNKSQQQEWDKVKGRFKEIVFNEPVEQLLYLASERIQLNFTHLILEKNFDKLFDSIQTSKVFPLRDYLNKGFARKLYPFDILSAAILTLALQRYGQNERSLFSFIESTDHLSINDFENAKASYYSIDKVYDYLINNFYSTITVKNRNSDYLQWSSIRKSLERIEGVLNADIQEDAQKIIKTIGLFNVFASGAAKLDMSFYSAYAKLAMGVKHPETIIEQLVKYKIIRYVQHSFKYVIFEGTDLDIDLAIDEAGRIIEKTSNVVNQLNQYFEFPFIAAKAIYYKTGTPRFFQFKLSEEPIYLQPQEEIDGYINLVFSDDQRMLKKVEACSKNCEEAILYGYYKNSVEIQNYLFEIQKIKKVISANLEDKVALKDLMEIERNYISLLNHSVLDCLYSNQGNIVWFYKGQKKKISNRQGFNQTLSSICNEIYADAPIFKNELINKTKISGQISLARNSLIRQLMSNIERENIGYSPDKFPPEKTIYLSLIRETGLHSNNGGVWSWQKPSDPSFRTLWEAGEGFLETTKDKQRGLQEFIDILVSKPFKLKQGMVDFWIPIFLLAKADEYALFDSNGYIPTLNEDVFELLNKKPGLFKIKAFDIGGIKLQLFNRYRILLNQAEHQKPTNKTFIQTIKPFLSFYKDLPQYTKLTKRLDKKTIALRNVIANSKDPEKTFFEEFPTALGFTLTELSKKPQTAEAFIKKMQNSIRELRMAYDNLINRFENYLIQEIGSKSQFPDYRNELMARFRKLKAHLLLIHQKSFFSRLQSQLDDRQAWLNSIAQSCIGKPLSNLSDEDEVLLYDRLKDLIYELDNLCELSKEDINEENEELLKLEITSFVQGMSKNLLRVSKIKTKEVNIKVEEIKSILSKDRKINITILAKLLQELLSNE